MSGEPVVVLAGEAMVRLITAAARVSEAGLSAYAIIGGVAVAARLQQTHRAEPGRRRRRRGRPFCRRRSK